MRKYIVLFIAVIALSTNAFAQKAKSEAGQASDLRKHVEYLASDQLAGRKTGEPGATTAAGYIANWFAQFKLEPGLRKSGNTPNYFQAFPYVAGVSIGDKTTLRLIPSNPANESKLEPSIAFVPFANSINGELQNVEIVFAGYGITTADRRYNDYAGIDVKGKAAFVFDGAPDTGASAPGRINIHTKASLAKDNGAKALVIVSSAETLAADPLSKLPFEPSMGETAIPVLIISRQAALVLFAVKEVKDLAEIEKWLAMRTNAPPSIQIKLSDAPKFTASINLDLVKNTVEAYNVVGILPGRDAQLKDEVIVIGAHYDHLGFGGRSSLSPNTNDIHHGADDNASGVSAMLELVRQFTKEKKNKRTIVFIAFGAEEEGLLGSKYYVNAPARQLDKTVAMINMDMVGRLSDNKLTVGGIGTAEEFRSLVEGSNLIKTEKPQTSGNGQSDAASTSIFSLQLNEDGFGPSDHSSFYSKQIPVLFFFTGTHVDYHKPSDTAEKINYDGLVKIRSFVSDIVKAIDGEAKRPTYKTARSSEMSPRTSFNVSLGTMPSYSENNEGLLLDGVREGSPAAKAGIKGGDIVVKLAGKEVRNISDYMYAMSAMKAGEEYEIVIKRGGETLILKIVPAPAARR